MNKADLISRTCGFLGLLIALIFFYFAVDKFVFTKQITHKLQDITLNINVVTATFSDPETSTERTPKLNTINENQLANDKANTITDINHNQIKSTSIENRTTLTSRQSAAKKTGNLNKRENRRRESYLKSLNTNKQQRIAPRKNPSKTTSNAKVQAANLGSSSSNRQINTEQDKNRLVAKIKQNLKDRLIYPPRAKRRNLQGTAVIEFNIKNGRIIGFRLIKSSGHQDLDKAAQNLANKVLNVSGNNSLNFILNVPIKYELN